jgi:hypothetical protein
MMIKRTVLLSVIFLQVGNCCAMDDSLESYQEILHKSKEVNKKLRGQLGQVSEECVRVLGEVDYNFTELNEINKKLDQKSLQALNNSVFSVKKNEPIEELKKVIGERQAVNREYQNEIQKMRQNIDAWTKLDQEYKKDLQDLEEENNKSTMAAVEALNRQRQQAQKK